MAKRPPSSRPSRAISSEDEEKYRTPLRPKDLGRQLALSSSTQTNLAVARNIASSNDYPVGGSKAGDRGRSLLGLLRDEMGDAAGTFLDQQLTLLARKYADRGEKLSQTSPESIQAVHAAVLGAVFSRWLELNPESETAKAIKRMLNKQKDRDVYANAIATLINQFVSTGALRPIGERDTYMRAVLRSAERQAQMDEWYGGPEHRSQVRKRGRLMAEFKQFKDKRRITSGDRGVLELFLRTRMDSMLRDVALKRQGMTEQQMVKALESVQRRIDEDRELMLGGPSPSIRSLDAPLNQEDEKTTRHDQVSADESEVGGLFQSDTWVEVSTNPVLRGVVRFIRDVYSQQAEGETNQGTELFMNSVPPVWQNYMLSLTSGDLTAEHIRKVNNDLRAAFEREGYLNENNKIQFPPLSPAFLRHYSQPDSRTFWRTLMDLVRQAPQISVPRLPPPKVNPMPRAHVLYPRRTRYGGVNSGTMPVYLPEVPFTQFPNLFLSNPNGEMRSTTARFAGKCKLTGEPFASGDTIYKVEGVGWCSEAGAQMASEMGEAELAKHARQAAHSKHLSDSEIRTWEAMGGSMTSRGTPMMDRKFVSVADAKAMIADASGHAGQHYDTEGWGSVRRPSRRA